MSYCFRCLLCCHKFEAPTRGPVIYCEECEQFDCVVRDYKAEAVGVDMSMLRAARG